MINQSIIDYIISERLRGLTDEVIQRELEKTGWKSKDIRDALALTPSKNISPSLLSNGSPLSTQSPERIALRALFYGASLFLISSLFLVFFGVGRNLENGIVFLAFAFTHIANSIAAYFLFLSVWRLSVSVWFRVWIGTLSFVVALFALTSTLHFYSLAMSSGLFDVIQRALLRGDDYMPFVIYFILLPLQTAVFFLLMITLWALKFIRRRSGGTLQSLRTHFWVLRIFFVMSLLALGDLYLVLSGLSFGF